MEATELTYKKGDRIIILVDQNIAKKYPALSAGLEYACEVTCQMRNTREPGYRVKTGPMMEFQIPARAVVRAI